MVIISLKGCGNALVVIEHNLDVVWLIMLSKLAEGAIGGFSFEGSPKELAKRALKQDLFFYIFLKWSKKYEKKLKIPKKTQILKGSLLSQRMHFSIYGKEGPLIVANIRSYSLLGTFEPLFDSFCFISLAALTYPVFYRPINRLMQNFSEISRNQLSVFRYFIYLNTRTVHVISILLLGGGYRSTQGFGNMVVSLALGEDEGRKFF